MGTAKDNKRGWNGSIMSTIYAGTSQIAIDILDSVKLPLPDIIKLISTRSKFGWLFKRLEKSNLFLLRIVKTRMNFTRFWTNLWFPVGMNWFDCIKLHEKSVGMNFCWIMVNQFPVFEARRTHYSANQWDPLWPNVQRFFLKSPPSLFCFECEARLKTNNDGH